MIFFYPFSYTWIRMITRVESSTIHNTYYTHNTHMLIFGHFQIHNTCYTHIFFYVYTWYTTFWKGNFFRTFCWVFHTFFLVLVTFYGLHEYAKLNWNEFEKFFAAEITSEIETCKKLPNMCMKWPIFAWNSDKKVFFR